MPETVQFVQARTTYRVSVTATAANLLTLVLAALNARTAGLGDQVKPYIIGGSLVSVAGFTVGDTAALVATKSITAGVDYSEPSTNFLRDTWATGASPLIVSVWVAV